MRNILNRRSGIYRSIIPLIVFLTLLNWCLTTPAAFAQVTDSTNWIGDVYPNGSLTGAPIINGYKETWPAQPDLNFDWSTLTSGYKQLSSLFSQQINISQGGKYLFQSFNNTGSRVYLQDLSRQRLEENAGDITYTGSWSTFSTAANSAGGAKFSTGNGASFSLSFTGASLEIFGFKASYYGIADVYLDGQKLGSIDYYSPITLFQQQLFAISGLSNTSHVLKVVQTGSKNSAASSNNINLDYISIGNGKGRFEVNSTNYTSTGAWSTYVSSNNSNGSAMYSDATGASLSIPFTGSSLRIGGYKAPGFGIAQVYIDGAPAGSIDYYNPSFQYQTLLFATSGLTDSTHTLKLVWTGHKNTQASGTSIDLDYIEVGNGSGKYEQDEANFDYSGLWQSFNVPDNSDGSAVYTDATNGSVSIKFTGPSISVGGYKAIYYGIGDVYLDNNKIGSIDYYNPTTTYQQDLFTKSGLTDSPHILKIVHTGNKNSQAVGASINVDYANVGAFFSPSQDNSINATYSGKWDTYLNPANSGGSAKYTDDPGASVTIPFTGTAVTIGGYKAKYYGIGDVYIDNNKVGSIDYYSPTMMYQQDLFTKSGLVNTSHTLKIIRTGNKDPLALYSRINLDYINVSTGSGTFEQDSPGFVYSGAWSTFTTPDNSGGSATYSDDPDAAVSYNFTGSSLTIGGYKSIYYGIADVYIDGNKAGSIDYYSPTTIYRQVLFQTTGLSNTSHTLKIVRTGNKNPLATSSYINIDNVVVGNGIGNFDQTGANFAYSGQWSKFLSSDNSQGSAMYSNDPGASVTINFTGSAVSVIGYKAKYYGIEDVYIDGNKAGTVDLYSPITQFQQVLFQTTGLADSVHTLKLVRTGTKNPLATGSNINVDGMAVSNDFQETSNCFSYVGAWSGFVNPGNSGGAAKYSNDPEASVTVNFSGSNVNVSGYRSIYYGIADVYLDGNKVGSIDYYSPSTQFQQRLFEITGLSPGQHTLKLVRTGNKNPLATSSCINVDSITVGDGSGRYEEVGANSSGLDIDLASAQNLIPVIDTWSGNSSDSKSIFLEPGLYRIYVESYRNSGPAYLSFHLLNIGQHKIVLDPGHGGRDPGAVANGLMEKKVNLAVALKLRDLLTAWGYQVEMTRDTDVALGSDTMGDLTNRVNIAKASGGDIFISIHSNASSSSSVTGTLGTYFRPDYQYAKGWTDYTSQAADNWHKSKLLADSLATSVAESTGQYRWDSESHAFVVLRQNVLPSSLIELGFLTNPLTASKMATQQWQLQAATGVANGINTYFAEQN